jgi:isopenicillin N synthase-like dioxygenase
MAPQKPEDLGTSLLAHTDFGSVTLLWNILGGLQILPQDAGQSDPDGISTKWQYVKPQAGCVIVNMGDAMVSFSGGLIRSNLHRVVPPPGEQAKYTRYSSAYFMRPEDGVFMRAVKGGDVIPPENGEGEGKPYTAKEWVALKSDRSRGPMGQPMKSIGGKL